MKYKILFFSEILGSGGGGIASQRIIDCFKDHEIKVVSVANEKNVFIKLKYILLRFYYRIKRFFLTNSDKFNFNSFNGEIGVYSVDNIEKKIKKFNPDIIIVTWIEFLISLKTLYEIKSKYNSSVIFVAMDNHLLTGGCRYVNECSNYINGCSNCLALKDNFKEIASNNYKHYRTYFKKIKPMFMLPSNHSKIFYQKSNLKFKFFEFDFWPIQYEYLMNQKLIKKEIKNKINKKNDYYNKKIIICPIQKFGEPRKGWQYLYHSIIDFQNQLSSNEIKIHFVFIGNLEKNHINSFKNFRVTYEYYDYLNRKELEQLYSRSDFGVVPSIQEWASISTNEMMTFGLPVINFSTGSSKNIIINGKNGFIINIRDVYDLSDKLTKINNMSEKEMVDMKLFTHDFALKNFKSELFEEKLINFYEAEKRAHIN